MRTQLSSLKRHPDDPIRGRLWFGLLLIPTLTVIGCTVPDGGPDEVHGVVLISIDTLRADHLGCYGYPLPTSPFIDSLAKSGTLFEQAVSTSAWTLPSHASLMTGLYPTTHRAVDAKSAISDSAATVAEQFHSADFSTGGVVASWFVSSAYGFDRGFDWFEDFGATARSVRRRKIPATRIVDQASNWLQRNASEPFFLFLHFYDPHYDYNPPATHREMFDTGYTGPRPRYRSYSHYQEHSIADDRLQQEVGLYDGEIHYVDAELRRLWETLEQAGLEDSTLLVVTSDHGEEFFDHGSWGHAHTLFDEQVRVPLIISGPGVERGQRIRQQVGLIDLMPTLLEVTGIAATPDLPGRSLWPLMSSTSHPDRDAQAPRPSFLETSRFDTNLIGIRRSEWKLITDLSQDGDLLYSLKNDPAEKQDLSTSHPDTLTELRSDLQTILATVHPDRWMLAWPADALGPVQAEVATNGRFVIGSVLRGRQNLDTSSGGRRIGIELQPGEILEVAVVPIDATLTFSASRTADRTDVPVLGGPTSNSLTPGAVTVSGLSPGEWTTPPPSDPDAVSVWLEQRRPGGAEVVLDDAIRERLKALGYLM